MFPIGRLVATPGALAFCKEHGINPIHIIARHVARDWREMCAEDQRANLRAIGEGSRILSGYMYANTRLYVITEASREVTTLLLASEY
jgi:hypothetical protein